MAAVRNTDNRRASRNRTGSSRRSSGRASRREDFSLYVEGDLAYAPEAEPARRRVRRTKPAQESRPQRASLYVNFPYLIFLCCAIAAMCFMCVTYLKMQADITELETSITALNEDLVDATLANDEEYDRIMGAVDLEQIKKTAMDELGMTYPDENQVVACETDDSDYVRQYADVPK